eukprot:3440713-Rhodomonas_salina.3
MQMRGCGVGFKEGAASCGDLVTLQSSTLTWSEFPSHTGRVSKSNTPESESAVTQSGFQRHVVSFPVNSHGLRLGIPAPLSL